MRDVYHDDLDSINDRLVEMAGLVGSMMGRATTALLDADLVLAEGVISADPSVDALYNTVEGIALDLMARQQPVASDLRILVTSLRMIVDLERMGDYAMHVAEVARRRYPDHSIPAGLRSTVLEMGQVASQIVEKAGSVIAGRDVALALELEEDDDVMDDYQQKLFTRLLSDERRYSVEVAIDVTLCGRYYERFADHAVSVARRVVFLVTGERADAVTAAEV